MGDRVFHLKYAMDSLKAHGLRICGVSRGFETDPVGCEPGAGKFLNLALCSYWDGTPFELLTLCQETEQKAGRPADHPHWHSRVLDIDIILFGQEKISGPVLTIPHPLALSRSFVMGPLADLAPDEIFPRTGQTFLKICERLQADADRKI